MDLVARGGDAREILTSYYAADDAFYAQGFTKKWNAGPFTAIGFKSKVTDFA